MIDEELRNGTDELQEELMLKYIANQIMMEESAEFLASSPELEGIEVPESLRTKLAELINEEQRKAVRQKRKVRLNRLSKICALVLVVLMLAGGITFTTVDAFRFKVIEFFTQEREESELIAPDDGLGNDAIIPLNWSGYWRLEYIPDGYFLTVAAEQSISKRMQYEDTETDSVLLFLQRAGQSSLGLENNEDIYEEVKINDIIGYYSTDKNHSYLLWINEGTSFNLSNMSLASDRLHKEELIKIAENVKFQK